MDLDLPGAADGISVTAGRDAGAVRAGRLVDPAAAVTALYAEHALGLTRLALVMVHDRQAAAQRQSLADANGRLSAQITSGTPRYLVTAVAGKAYVRSTATGRVLARIRPPARVFAFEGVAAAPGDRTFYLAGAVVARPNWVKIEFFRLVLAPNGLPGGLQRLPGPPYRAPLPLTSNGLITIPLAVSPDGRQLAYGSGSRYPDTPGSPLMTGNQGIVVQSVSTGARHTWKAWPSAHGQISNLSWARGGRLGFLATLDAAAVANGKVVRRPGSQLNVLATLNTAACGSSLIGDSRLVAYGSGRSTDGGHLVTRLPGPSGAAISQDGQSVYARIWTRHGGDRLVVISAATGKVIRVLLSGPRAADPAVRVGGPTGAAPAPMSIDGTSLLYPISLPHAHLPQHSGRSVVIGHLAMIDLATGHVTQLPIPIRYSTGAALGPVGAAW